MHQIIQHLKDSSKSACAVRLLHREISQMVRADVRCSGSASSQFHPSLKQRNILRCFLSCNPQERGITLLHFCSQNVFL